MTRENDMRPVGSIARTFFEKLKARQEWEAEHNRVELVDPLQPERTRTLTAAWNMALEEDHQRTVAREVASRRERIEQNVPMRLRGLGVPDPAIDALRSPRETGTWDAAGKFIEGSDKFLLLLGTVGTGKTVAGARCLAWGIRRGYSTEFLRASSLSRMSGFDDRALFERVCTARVVVLDDFGTEHLNDYAKSLFHEWLDRRYGRADLKTVITANLRLDQFRARAEERAYDRIAQSAVVHVSTDKSMRRSA